MKWADYLVSKEKWVSGTNRINSFIVHDDNTDTVGTGVERDRNWIIQKMNLGKTFACISRSEGGKWSLGGRLTKNANGGLVWNDKLPHILPKRKTFISYYHNDDQDYKDKFKNLTSDLITNKSVEDGDLAP